MNFFLGAKITLTSGEYSDLRKQTEVNHDIEMNWVLKNGAKPPRRGQENTNDKLSNSQAKSFLSDAITKSWRGTCYTIYKNLLKPVQ